MESRPLDRIRIKDLLVRCIIGVRDWERLERQDVHVDVTLHADLSRAGVSDSIDDTVDYVGIKKRIVTMAEASSFFLIETLAERIAQECLQDPRVRQADVVVEKPGALRFARTVAVEITRHQPSDA